MANHSIRVYFADISPIRLTHAHLVPDISITIHPFRHARPACIRLRCHCMPSSLSSRHARTLRPRCARHLAASPDAHAHAPSLPLSSPWSPARPHGCLRRSVFNVHDPSRPPAPSPRHLAQRAHTQPGPAVVLPTVPLHHMDVHAPSHLALPRPHSQREHDEDDSVTITTVQSPRHRHDHSQRVCNDRIASSPPSWMARMHIRPCLPTSPSCLSTRAFARLPALAPY